MMKKEEKIDETKKQNSITEKIKNMNEPVKKETKETIKPEEPKKFGNIADKIKNMNNEPAKKDNKILIKISNL